MENSSKNTWFLYFASFVLAFCSILYELVLAQGLSSTLGNTILRYNLTIGIYCASLGAGAILCSKWNPEHFTRSLIDVEIALATIGGLSAILIAVFDHYLRSLGVLFSFDASTLISIFNHSLIILIGVLSGIELPLLMKMAGKIQTRNANRVLILDYSGTLFGVIVFPLLMLPVLGIFSSALLVSFLNFLVALLFIINEQTKFKGRFVILLVGLFLSLLGIIFQEELHHFIVYQIYLPRNY